MAKAEADYTDEDRAALRALQQAAERLKKATGGTSGQGIENAYADAYRKCYSLGLKDYKLVTGLVTR